MSKHTPDPHLLNVVADLMGYRRGHDGKHHYGAIMNASMVIPEHCLVSLEPGQIVVGPDPDEWCYEMPVFDQDTGKQVDTVWTALSDPSQRGTGRRHAIFYGPIEETNDG